MTYMVCMRILTRSTGDMMVFEMAPMVPPMAMSFMKAPKPPCFFPSPGMLADGFVSALLSRHLEVGEKNH